MRLFPLLAFLACSTAEPPRPRLPFEQTGAAPSIALAALDAALTLPTADTVPLAVPEQFVIDDPTATTKPLSDGYPSRWTAPSPITLPRANQNLAPQGMTLTEGGVVIPYVTGSNVPEGARSWRLARGVIHLSGAERPARGSLRMRYSAPAESVRRLHFEDSGLTANAFTRLAATVGDTTRSGLLLPAPTTATWEVTLPSGTPSFTTHAHILRPDYDVTPPSDGAVVSLEITSAGESTVVERMNLAGASESFTPWEVDLSSWAGESVSIALRTEAGASPTSDYVFLGSPTISAPEHTFAVRRIIVIGFDTLRPDHLGVHGYTRPTSPELDAFADRAVVFDQAWAPAPRTRPSFRSSTTGRRPLDAVGATTLGEVFSEQGFATAGIVANPHLNPRFGFHEGFDLWQLNDSARAHDQVDRALDWLWAHKHRDTFLFLHVMDPHLYYGAPGSWRDQFVTDPDPSLPPRFSHWMVSAWDAKGTNSEKRRRHIVDLYDGEIAYTSHEIGRFLEGLEALGGNDLIVMHSDHGEEFWEHGGFEHNHALWDEVTRAMLWIRPPGPAVQRRADVPATLADIAPTLYAYAGLQDTPPTDGIDLRPWIEGKDTPPHPERPLPLGYFMYAQEQWGVIARGHKYVLRTADGAEQLYDLMADPREQRNLADTSDLAPFRAALATAHGMTVGPGWRVRMRSGGGQRMVIELPYPALGAGVIDPEAERPRRSNIVWGEKPPARPEDVGRVLLSRDRQRVIIEPGGQPGTVWIHFDKHVPLGGALVVDGVTAPIVADGTGKARWFGTDHTVVFQAGTIVQPPPTEAQRIAGTTPVSGSEEDALRALGYLSPSESGVQDTR